MLQDKLGRPSNEDGWMSQLYKVNYKLEIFLLWEEGRTSRFASPLW
jgi:hypothetical protein